MPDTGDNSPENQTPSVENEVSNQQPKPAPSRRPRITSAKDFFLNELESRSAHVNESLKKILVGKIFLDLSQAGRYLIENVEGRFKVVEVLPGVTSPDANCNISISEQDLIKINQGHLNAQICMLSDRVKITGNTELAMYFFNLLAV